MLVKPSMWIAPALCGVALVAASGLAVANQAPKPAPSGLVLQRAQRAVAGDVNVTSLYFEGSRSALPAPTPVRLEIRWLFPDHYRLLTESSSMMRYAGFARGAPLNGGKQLDPSQGSFTPGEPSPSFVSDQRAAAARLLLGILGDARGVLALQTAPGDSGAIRVTGPNNFECVVDLDPSTGAPVRVRYRDMVGFMPAPVPGQRQSRSDPPEPAEVTISFLDRRPVSGVRVPHRITRVGRSLSGGRERVIEDLQFGRVVVNVPMTAADFEKVD